MSQTRQDAPLATSFTVATYNVHSWVDMDGRFAPEKALAVIKSMDADVVALQEVTLSSPGSAGLSAEELARELDMEPALGVTLFRRDAHYGNLLLSRFPIYETRRWDISVPGREPRGVLDTELEVGGQTVHVLATHLGLRLTERAWQMRQLTGIIDELTGNPTLLLGDLNAWLPLAPWFVALRRRFAQAAAPRTFPSRFPLLAFDRIMVNGRLTMVEAGVLGSRQTRQASDHLPVWARLSPAPSGS